MSIQNAGFRALLRRGQSTAQVADPAQGSDNARSRRHARRRFAKENPGQPIPPQFVAREHQKSAVTLARGLAFTAHRMKLPISHAESWLYYQTAPLIEAAAKANLLDEVARLDRGYRDGIAAIQAVHFRLKINSAYRAAERRHAYELARECEQAERMMAQHRREVRSRRVVRRASPQRWKVTGYTPPRDESKTVLSVFGWAS